MASRHPSGSPYFLAFALFLAHVFAYADRNVVSVLLPFIRTSLELTLVEASIIQGMAFSLFFAIAGIPIGRLADRMHRLRLLAAGIVIWSVATVACGLSRSFAELAVARMTVAVGEACLIPTAASLLADSFDPGRRGRVVSLVLTGAPIGGILSAVGGGALLTVLETDNWLARHGIWLESWQAVFLTLGIPGLCLALMLFCMKEPARRAGYGLKEERTDEGIARLLFRYPLAFFGFLALQSLISLESYAIVGWVPTILMTTYGRNPAEAGVILGLLSVGGGIVAYVLSGILSDRMLRWRPRYGRMIAPGLILPVSIASMAWLYAVRDLDSAILALAGGIFGSALTFASAVVTLQAIVPNRLHGQAVAILYLTVNIFGAGLAPTVVAFVAEAIGDLQRALALVGFAALVLAMVLWLLTLRAYARVPNHEAEELARKG